MPGIQPQATPNTTYRKDYRPADFFIDNIDLHFDLDEVCTVVRARLTITANNSNPSHSTPLVLTGRELDLRSLVLDGKLLGVGDYYRDDEALTIPRVPQSFVLEIVTEIKPRANTSLSGLYISAGNFCTQCEAEGFRKITYFLDRPDVLARYTTTIVADKTKYPVLLANGNLIAVDELEGNRHRVKWQDPFPKPSYLFALVAGDLARIEDSFTTMTGRKVQLHVYIQHHNKDKCAHAMASLKKAMVWDEQVYGREYDLDIYMIVAVDDFNMGAMENKGLNVFNSKYVLAKPDTATDADYQAIEGVIAHEYFHNWSGNRITCRDWFQLSLKEGFTVFRDQQFSADMTSGGVKRIGDVKVLRTHQFREDAGPMAHPVRPDSYVEINNFYTLTIYNKGAEVVRMLFNMLGTEGFRKGTDLFFARHDGQAVTTDDFVKALEEANGEDFNQFRLWYQQAGTPQLEIHSKYDPQARTLTLNIDQTCAPTPGQEQKQPFHIPFAIGLLDRDGKEMPMQLEGEADPVAGTRVLHVRAKRQTFIFTGVPSEPVPSLLRGFSAPVKLTVDISDEELSFLMSHDSDPFNRWEAGHRFAVKIMVGLIKDFQQGRQLTLDSMFRQAFVKTLQDHELDKALIAEAITLPSEIYLTEFMQEINPHAIHEIYCFVHKALAQELQATFFSVYEANVNMGSYHTDPQSIGRRSLKNRCLTYLMWLDEGYGETPIRRYCLDQFHNSNNMTDVMAALTNLANVDCPERDQVLEEFHEKWRADSLVIDKWLSIQATSRLPGTLDRVKMLTGHADFSIKNPNKVRALIGAFCQANQVRFHDRNGAGYKFLAENVIKLDNLNPQIAARLAGAFSLWRNYEELHRSLMKTQLETILEVPHLSKDVYEIVSKSLV